MRLTINKNLYRAVGLLSLLVPALVVGGCGFAKGDLTRLEVYVTDPYFDSVTFPQGHECTALGGDGYTPSLVVRNIPPGANAVIMEYSDRDSQSMDDGGHGKIGYVIPEGAWEVHIPSVPANTFDLPENFYVVEPHKNQVPALGLVGAYLPPCTQAEGHRFYMTVKVVYDRLPKDIGKKKGRKCPPGYHVDSCNRFEQAERDNQQAAWEGCRNAVRNSKYGHLFTEKDIKEYCSQFMPQGDDTSGDQAKTDRAKAEQGNAVQARAGQAQTDPDKTAQAGRAADGSGQGGADKTAAASQVGKQNASGVKTQEDESDKSGQKKTGARIWGKMVDDPIKKKPDKTKDQKAAEKPPAKDGDQPGASTDPQNLEPAYKTTAKLERFKYNPLGVTVEDKPKQYKDIDQMVQDYSQRECPAPEKEKAKKKKAGPHTYKRPTLLGQKNIALGTVIYNRSGTPSPPETDGPQKK